MLSQQDQANQNNPLSLFIGKAQQIKGKLHIFYQEAQRTNS